MPVVSNSKLTQAEKMILRDMRAEQEGTVLYRSFDTAIVAKFGPNTVKFATSVRSPNEKKSRNKVGEFHARTRFEYEQTAVLNLGDFLYLVEAFDFQEIVK